MSRLTAVLLFLSLTLPSFAVAQTVTWDGSTDGDGDGSSWNDPLNWSTDSVPGPGASVEITTQDVVTLGTDRTVSSLLLSGNVLAGAGSLTISSSMNWSRGTIGIDVNLRSSAVLTIENSRHTLDNATITVASGATAEWIGGNVRGSNGAGIVNRGTWKHDTFADLDQGSGLPSIFQNEGTYQFTGTSSGVVKWRFDNTAVVDAQQGTLLLAGGGRFSSAATGRASGGTLSFSGGTFELNGTALETTGSGAVRLGGATIAGSGPQPFAGALEWTDGTLAVDATLAAGGSLLLDNSRKTLNGATLTVQSGANATYVDGDLHGENGASIVNQGTWSYDSFSRLETTGTGARPSFQNEGTLEFIGASRGEIQWGFVHSGVLDVSDGTFSLSGGGSLASGATVRASGGIINLSGGTMQINGTLLKTSNGGIVRFGGATIAGSGPQPFAGALEWTDGTLAVDATLAAGGSLLLDNSRKTLNGATLTVQSGANATYVDGDLHGENGASIVNQGTWSYDSFSRLETTGTGARPSFQNEGTLEFIGASRGEIQWGFVHSGVLDVSDGTFSLSGGGSLASGATVRASGGIINLSGGTMQINGTLLETSNGGIIRFGGATIAGIGPQAFNGALEWTRGTLATPLTLADGATAILSGRRRTLNSGTLTVSSNAGVSWTDGDLTGENGARIVNRGTWTQQTVDGFELGNGFPPVFINEGEYRYENSSSRTTHNWRVENSGSMTVSSGTFTLSGGGESTGTLRVERPATLSFDQTAFSLPETGRIEGTGTLQDDDVLRLNGTLAPGTPASFLDVDGDVAFDAPSTSALEIGIGGTSPGSDHDQLRVTGLVNLAGTLRAELTGGFIPKTGQSYTIVQSIGGITGQFDATELPQGFSVVYETNAVKLTAGDDVIPVEFAGVSAHWDENDVRVEWNTASETNNAGFEVERKTDSTPEWTTIGYVEGRGTTTIPQRYTMDDTTVPFTVESTLYRIKQIDVDGTYSYSRETSLSRGAPNALRMHPTFPNPVRDEMTVRFELPEPGPLRLTVYDILGRRRAVLVNETLRAGRHERDVRTYSLASGTYFLRLQTQGGVHTERFTVVR